MNGTPLKPIKFAIGCLLVAAIGCSPSKPIYLNDVGDMSFYLDQATSVEYPDVDIPSLDEVTQAQRPMTVSDPEFTSFEDVTLEDVVSMALLNTKVIRGYGTPSLQSTRVSPGQDTLANNPNAAATVYNIAIRESEPGFINQGGALSTPSAYVTNTGLEGNQGVEAALADFDAQFTSSFNVAKSDEPRNGTSILNSEVFQQTQTTWQSQIAKKSANGTQLLFRNINQYTANNNPLVGQGGIQNLDSWYRTTLEAEIRQPLLRGRGAFIQRMPIVISRINTDQELANLESTLQNMVVNLEIRYWDLYLAYRNFEAAKTGRDAALVTWRIVKDQYEVGVDQVTIQSLAQSAEQYHFFDAQVIDAYNNLLNAEGQLRYLLGWSSTDGRFLRPTDEPIMAPVEFDWDTSLVEALTYRPEIRQERWEIKKRELALQYAKNGLLPELNISFVYRWLGLGNKFGTSDDSASFIDPATAAQSGALNELYGGNYQELSVGGTFAMPVGFRREQANVRNAQMKLAREIARAEDIELDVTKELSEVMRALSANQMIMRSSFNRWISTTEEVEHFQRLADEEIAELDIALDAQRRRAQSEIAFYTALVEFNKSIALLHRRKGTILPYSGIDFSEGPWPGKAYVDAGEHARRRGASRQINYGWTRPQVISRGPDQPTAGNTGNVMSVAPRSANPVNLTQPVADVNLGSESFGEWELDGLMLTDPNANQPTEAVPVNSPTPARRNDEGAQRQSKAAGNRVIQVNYQEIAETAPEGTVQPVAVRKPGAAGNTRATILGTAPLRDAGPRPEKRLRDDVESTTPVTGQESSIPQSQPSISASNLPWEKLGLARPESMPQVTTARIRTSGGGE